MDTAAERFGVRLKALRRSRALTQEQLAERANMSQKGVAALERGARFPRETTVEALADALAVSVDELTGAILGPPSDEIPTEIKALLKILHGRPSSVIRAVSAVARVMADEFDRLNAPKESA